MTMTTGSFVRTFVYLGCAMLLIFAKPAPRARVPLERQIVAKNLATFDDLDFNVFSNQRWDDLSKSHSKDIIVHWPDGHTTSGIEQHIADLRAMFVYAPDTRIKAHPVKFGSGEWTCVIGEMEGTFTKPMPIGHARSLQPTGRHFRIPMSTIGRWKDGVMVEEFLFWDNQAYSKQLGL
jgi:hypothetical protein